MFARWPRLRRLLRWTGATILLIFVLLAGIYLLRDRLLAEPLANFVAEQMSEALGGRFSLERIEGDYFTELVVIGLRTDVEPTEGPLRRIDIDRASVRYSLWRLLDDPVGAIRQVEASGAVVELDLDRPSEPSEEPLELERWLPHTFPRLDIGARVRIRAGGQDYSFDFVANGGGRSSLNARFEAIDLAGELQSPLLRLRIEHTEFGTFTVQSWDSFAGIVPKRIEAQVLGELGITAELEVAGGEIGVKLSKDAARVTASWIDLAKLPEELVTRLPADMQLPDSGMIFRAEIGVDEPLAPDPAIFTHITLHGVQWDEWRATRIALTGEWRDGVARLSKLDAVLADGSIEARGIELRPDLAMPLVRLDSIQAELSDVRTPLRRLGLATNLPDVPVSFTMRAHRAEGEPLKLDALRIAAGDSHVSASGEFTLPVDVEAWEETPLKLTLDALLDARSLPASETAITGAVSIKGSVAGTPRAPTALLEVHGSGLTVDGEPIETLEAKGELAWPKLQLDSLRFLAAPGSLDLSGSADLEQRVLTGGRYMLEIHSLEELAKLIPGAPAMKGTLRGVGSITRASLDGEREGDANLTCEGLEIEGVVIESATIRATLRGDTIALPEFSVRAPEWSVAGSAEGTASFSTGAITASVTALKATAAGRNLELRAPLAIEWDGKTAIVRDLDATALDGQILGHATYGETITLHLEATDLDVARAADDARGHIGFTLDARGTPDAPRWELTIQSRDLVIQNKSATVDVSARQDQHGIHIDAAKIEGVPNLRLDASGFAPIEAGAKGVRFLAGEPALQLSVALTPGDLAPYLPKRVQFSKAALVTTLKGNTIDGTFRVSDLRWSEAPKDYIAGETVVEITGDADAIELRLDGSDFGPLVAKAELHSDAGIDWKDPRGLLQRIRTSTLRGSASLQIPDLEPLTRLPGSPIAHCEGSGRVEITLAGKLPRPDIDATVEIDAPRMRLVGDVPALQDVKALIRVTPDAITIEKFDAQLGYAPLAIRGDVKLPADAQPILDVKVNGTNILLSRTPYLRLRADVDLALAGPLDALAASGAVTVTNMLWSEPIKLLSNGGATAADNKLHLFSLRDEPLKSMTLDVAITANETIRLDNNVLRGALSAGLRLHGNGGVPKLEGRVDFRDLRLTFPITRERLDITRGSLVFPHDDPFRPSINASGEARKLGHDLAVEVRGKIPDVEILIKSVPTLSREEAIVLLTTGSTKERLQESGELTAGIYVGRSILDAITGPSDPDKESLMDRFEFESGKDVSTAGDPTMEARFRIVRRLYLTAERDRWEDYNGGIMLRFRFR